MEEEFIAGFCRTMNDTRSVCCEYEEENGRRVLTFMDCAEAVCEHHSSCLIYKEAHELEG